MRVIEAPQHLDTEAVDTTFRVRAWWLGVVFTD